ncbi:MAG: hypothetical protein ONB46_10615 [candidate division KSB1 bacterium]|nr:hypothetical protein [candidate division KSB1 bacterium]MDZ7366257.1 hypothetical protein [candidate division KSB1 bacterium]MDZ7404475.1 hypothetical protein [candidate division KSB1 bacterium]
MIRFMQIKEKVQIPINGQWVELQRIKIVRVEGGNGAGSLPRNGAPRFPARQLNAPLRSSTAAFPQTMPRQRQIKSAPAQMPGLRPLGQVFSNEAGQLCEWANGKPRFLGEVLADGEGRLYEQLSDMPPAYQPSPGNGSSNGHRTVERTAPTENLTNPKPPPLPKRQPIFREPRGPAYEKIFADPGLHLQLPFAALREELGALLAPADHLPSDELLDCHLQIYQVRMPVSLQQIAAVELGEARLAWRFRPLTQAKAEAWGIPEIYVGEPTSPKSSGSMGSQRLYMITPAADPTPESLEQPEPAPAKANNEVPEPLTKSHRHGLKDLFRNLKK